MATLRRLIVPLSLGQAARSRQGLSVAVLGTITRYFYHNPQYIREQPWNPEVLYRSYQRILDPSMFIFAPQVPADVEDF